MVHFAHVVNRYQLKINYLTIIHFLFYFLVVVAFMRKTLTLIKIRLK